MPHTLADVLPAVAASFGMAVDNSLDLVTGRDVVVLLIDGLGAELLTRHREVAPTLAGHVATNVNAGFPATTAAGIASLALGAPCATHGIIGYSFAVPDPGGMRLLNALRWRLDSATGPDARTEYPPETVQRGTSRLQDLAAHGVDVHYVVPEYQRRSGLTRAAFRATGILHPAADLDQVCSGIRTVANHSGPGRRFAYAYFPDLDAAGHLYGPGSPQWQDVLAAVDAGIADLLTDLPSTCTLLVTGDHGMIRADTVIDLDSRPALRRDVRLIGGEARVRHVYLERPEGAADVAAVWTGELSGHAQVAGREQVLDEQWFGPAPGPEIRGRIGDLVVVAQGHSVLVCPDREPMESAMIGHHGARTADEQLVPLIVAGGEYLARRS
ncbi:nucleotide pyrophosphatase/phosphodiesterase family protein [Nocardia sp. NPDC052254]|uniref:alkaline phosphatase family protein n=1 Tax=Nocardia sp. NPDC052254 TaxID=3155681 RepID=UPI003444A640